MLDVHRERGITHGKKRKRKKGNGESPLTGFQGIRQPSMHVFSIFLFGDGACNEIDARP